MSETIRFDLGTNPTDVTIQALSLLLTRITTENDKVISKERPEHHSTHKRSSSQSGCTCFHARSVPSIAILPYLQRINRYCPAANEVFISLLIYFDRMAQSAVNMRIDSFNIHRLIISGVTVASKLFSDTFFTNTRYAKVRFYIWLGRFSDQLDHKKKKYWQDDNCLGGRAPSCRAE